MAVTLATCTGLPNHGSTSIPESSTARCSPRAASIDGVRLVRSPRIAGGQRLEGAGGCAGRRSAPEDGPPVSVMRLILLKPEVDRAAITWATVS
jgi:hypothetical protein